MRLAVFWKRPLWAKDLPPDRNTYAISPRPLPIESLPGINSEMVIEVVRIYVSLHPLVEGKCHGELHLPFWAGFRAPPDKAFQRCNIQFGVAGALENHD